MTTRNRELDLLAHRYPQALIDSGDECMAFVCRVCGEWVDEPPRTPCPGASESTKP